MTIPTALWRWQSKSRRISNFESWPGFSLWTLRDQLEAKPIQTSSIAFKLGQGLPSVFSSFECALDHQKLIDSTFYNLFQKWKVSAITNANDWIAQMRWICWGAKLQLSSGKVKTARHLQIPELLSQVLLANRINLYQEPLILTFIGRANQLEQTTLQLNLQKKICFY